MSALQVLADTNYVKVLTEMYNNRKLSVCVKINLSIYHTKECGYSKVR